MPGTADWLIGEDPFTGDTVALRDMCQPFRQNLSDLNLVMKTYCDDSTFWLYYADPYAYVGWPYEKGGPVVRFAFYLLSEGSDTGGVNAGHPYSAFDGIGVAAAARVAMRANLYYLDDFSVFADIRRTWLLAAQDLIDSGKVPEHAVVAAESAMDAVGIGHLLRFRHGSATRLQVGSSGNVLLQAGAKDSVSLMGLVMRHTGGKGASLRTTDSAQFRVSRSVLDYSMAYLASPDSLAGDLVFRAPDGVVQMAIDPSGSAHIRVRDRWNSFIDYARGL